MGISNKYIVEKINIKGNVKILYISFKILYTVYVYVCIIRQAILYLLLVMCICFCTVRVYCKYE